MSDQRPPGNTNETDGLLPEKPGVIDGPPPFLGTWGRIYSAVLFILLTLIVLFWAFGKVSTP